MSYEQDVLHRTWPILCRIVAMLTLGLQAMPENMSGVCRLQHLARLGESMLRRWLLVAALFEGALEEASNACPSPQMLIQAEGHRHASADLSANPAPVDARIADPHGNTSHTVHLPLFRLLEPERPLRFNDVHYTSGPGPRLTWLDQPRLPDPIHPDRPRTMLTRLRQRCDTLQAVIDNPETHTKRMAKWLMRAAAKAIRAAGRVWPLRVGAPPGSSRRQKRKNQESQRALSALHNLSWELRDRTRPP